MSEAGGANVTSLAARAALGFASGQARSTVTPRGPVGRFCSRPALLPLLVRPEGYGPAVAPDYLVIVVRGWTKEKLASRIEERLRGIPPEDIISINYYVEPVITLFFRRNSALITIRPPADEAAADPR